MTITELAIKRPVLIIVLFTTLALLGIFGYSQMQYELIPKLDIPVVTINTQYPGASAQEVESSVTKKIEDAVSGLDKIDSVVATSMENVSTVTINFTQEANIDFALQDAQRKVNQIIANLPSGVKTPALSKVSLDDMPVLILGATSNLPDVQFYQLMNDHIKPRLSQLAGVGQVMIVGGKQRTIRVNLNHDKLNSYKLSAGQVLQAVQSGNLEYPTGSFKDSDRQFGVRLAGKFQSLEELRELVVGQSDDGLIRLADVAEVRDGTKDTEVITRINGKATVGVMVQKQSDANAVNVSKNVRAELAAIEKEYAKINLRANLAMDNSTFTVDSANAVKEDLLLAILLVAGVMLLFLHSYRNALIVMVAIPTSLVTTFIGMWIMGATLNIITLLALSLVIGILVDDAIVVLENIYRHMEMGKDKRTASLDGRNEIGFTALSITMVDVVVYLPLCLVSGVIGGILRAFSLVIVVSTLTSLFVSFTVTPMLSSRFGRLEQLTGRTWMGRFGLWFERVYEVLTQDYLKALRLCLKHPVIVLLVALAMFIGAISLVGGGFIGSEFMPPSDQGSLQVSVEMPNGTKLEQTNQITQMMEQAMTRLPEVETVFVATGIGGQNSTASNNARFYVNLIPKEKRRRSTEEVRKDLSGQFAMIPGLKVYITTASGMSGSSTPIQLAVQGSNWSVVSQAAEQVKKIAETIPGTSDVRLSSEAGKPEMKVVFDRQKMASLELDVATVGQTLQIGLTGNDDSKFLDTDGNEYPIQVMLDSSNRTRTDDIGALTVKNRSGKLVQLSQFTTIAPSSGPTKLERRDRNYAISVMSEAVGRASGDIGSDIMKAVAQAQLPPGVSVGFVGTLKSQQESFINLGIALIAAIIFVYLIMAALYNSFIYPFSVLFSVPLAIIGALLALALTQNTLAIFSIMGMIMLVGLVSKNAILLVDFANRAREEEGLSVNEALIRAGQERLRPILMTTLTMIFGMLPLALSSAPGSEFKNGLGWALIGGLTVSMLMTLVVVPVVYTRIEKIRVFFLGLFGRNKISLNKARA
jgi:HAE1 family hydrophobic/amphiphilic exporter-1